MKRKEVFTIFLRTLMPIIGLVLVLDLCLMQEEASSVPPPGETKTVLNAATQLRDELNQAMGLLEECFGHPVDLQGVRSTSVTLTAYSSTVEQCDATPYLTASDQSVHVGIIAVSNDLMKELGLRFGQRVLIPGYGLFEVQDSMHPRWHRRVDIWQENSEVARRFGNRPGTIIWIDQQESPTRSAQIEGTSDT